MKSERLLNIQKRMAQSIEFINTIDRELAHELVWLVGEALILSKRNSDLEETHGAKKSYAETLQGEIRQLHQSLAARASEVGELRQRISNLEVSSSEALDSKHAAVDMLGQMRRRLFRLEQAYSILRKTLDEAGLCVWKTQAMSAVHHADAIYAPPKAIRPQGVQDA